MLERGGKDQNIVEKIALEKANTAAESTASENATSESTARKTDDSGGTSACDQPVMRQGAGAKLCREVRASSGSRGHYRLVDRREEGTSAGGAATEGTQAEEGAELAGKIDEMASCVR